MGWRAWNSVHPGGITVATPQKRMAECRQQKENKWGKKLGQISQRSKNFKVTWHLLHPWVPCSILGISHILMKSTVLLQVVGTLIPIFQLRTQGLGETVSLAQGPTASYRAELSLGGSCLVPKPPMHLHCWRCCIVQLKNQHPWRRTLLRVGRGLD